MTKIQPNECAQCQVKSQPNYNAVKIDINNPKVDVAKDYTTQLYDYPSTSIYEPNSQK